LENAQIKGGHQQSRTELLEEPGPACPRNRFIFQLINFDSDTANPVRAVDHFMGQLTGKATNCLIGIYVKAINSLLGQLCRRTSSSFNQNETELWALNLIRAKEMAARFRLIDPTFAAHTNLIDPRTSIAN